MTVTATRRSELVGRVRAALEAEGSVRWQMLLILLLSGGVGFLSSYILLQFGLTNMPLRYMFAVLLAYAAFLGSLGVWLRRYGTRDVRSELDAVTSETTGEALLAAVDGLASRSIGRVGDRGFGGGGGFSGGGGGARWTDTGPQGLRASDGVVRAMPLVAPVGSAEGTGAVWEVDAEALEDADDGGPLVYVVAGVVAAIVGVVLFAVAFAPRLFAEIGVDSALAAGAHGRVSVLDRRHWLANAFRRTIVPALVIMAALAAAGHAVHSNHPGAQSISRVWERPHASRLSDRPPEKQPAPAGSTRREY